MFPPFPPTGVTVADPLLSPLHTTSLTKAAVHVSSSGSATVTSHVVVQPLMSVTVTVCSPASSMVAAVVFSPLSHAYTYGAVPPDGETEAIPLDSPLHSTGLINETVHESTVGSVIVTSQVVVQPFASVTVTTWTPAESVSAVCLSSPLSHR